MTLIEEIARVKKALTVLSAIEALCIDKETPKKETKPDYKNRLAEPPTTYPEGGIKLSRIRRACNVYGKNIPLRFNKNKRTCSVKCTKAATARYMKAYIQRKKHATKN